MRLKTWNPSASWASGALISTVEDLLVYGRALGTDEGLLPPERQAERLDSLSQTDTPEQTYGLGLAGARGWGGHHGLSPGFTTALFYHPELDAVVAVEVNADYLSGDCSPEVQTVTDGQRGVPCDYPNERILAALTEALGAVPGAIRVGSLAVAPTRCTSTSRRAASAGRRATGLRRTGLFTSCLEEVFSETGKFRGK